MLIEVARGYLRREGTAEASREYRGEDRGRDFVRMTVYSLSCSLSGDRLDPDRVIRVVLACADLFPPYVPTVCDEFAVYHVP